VAQWMDIKVNEKGRKWIMYLGTKNVGRLKNKCEIIIIKDLEKLKLYIITFSETEKEQWTGNDWWIRSIYSGVSKDKEAKRWVFVIL